MVFNQHDINSRCVASYYDTINQDGWKIIGVSVTTEEVIGKQYRDLPASHERRMKAGMQCVGGGILKYLNLALNYVRFKTKRGIWRSGKIRSGSRLPLYVDHALLNARNSSPADPREGGVSLSSS